jgi:hypothetical protein
MKCRICGKPIGLVPSAKERAKKWGGRPSDYSRLFANHADCATQKRNQDTSELIERLQLLPQSLSTFKYRMVE